MNVCCDSNNEHKSSGHVECMVTKPSGWMKKSIASEISRDVFILLGKSPKIFVNINKCF